MQKFITALGISALCATAQASFMPPVPPPELDETLTSFQTREQQALQEFLHSGTGGSALTLGSPAAAGDTAAGVVRLSFDYVGDLTISVPRYGMSVLRFYDGAGQPLEVGSFRIRSSAFLPQLSPSPYELIVRPNEGASSANFVVDLAQYSNPLVFKLASKAVSNGERAVQTFVYSLRLASLHAEKALDLEPFDFVKLHPQDQLEVEVSFAKLQALMLTALSELTHESRNAGAGR